MNISNGAPVLCLDSLVWPSDRGVVFPTPFHAATGQFTVSVHARQGSEDSGTSIDPMPPEPSPVPSQVARHPSSTPRQSMVRVGNPEPFHQVEVMR
jgi:hypothetical protein